MDHQPAAERAKKYRKYLGPSQLGTVLGIDMYNTVDALKSEIENGYVPWDSYATRFGKEHETIAKYFYQKLENVTITEPKFITDEKLPHFGGICDGLIDQNTGLEIKCHVDEKNLIMKLPETYLVQVAGYMYLYKRKNWILMSCVFDQCHALKKYTIHKITWDQVGEKWENEWYPKVREFIGQLKWC